MRYIPVTHLKGGEVLAVNIINANMMVIISENTTITVKMIDKIKKYGIYSVYIKDPEMSQFYEDNLSATIEPETRNNSVNQIKTSFEKFEVQLNKQKKSMKFSDSGSELFQNMKKISNNLIDEILNAKDTEISMIDIKNASDYHYEHSISVASLSIIIGTELGLPMKELENLAYGALLIDIGCNWVNEALLQQVSELTKSEMDTIKGHVEIGYEYITNNTNFNAHVKSIIMHHHERINGSGYPKGLKEEEIHPLSKIVMIADVYDALTSDRPHRKAHNQHEALEFIMANAGTLFDFQIASVFARKIVPYPVGTYVLLSNSQKGIIIENNRNFPLRPIIRTFGKSLQTDKSSFQINLIENNNITIEKVIYSLT